MLRRPLSKVVGLVGCLLVLICLAPAAPAHFLLNLNVRIVHVEHFSDGFRIYLRLPMPYVVASLAGPEIDDNLPDPAPFTANARENGRLVHLVDFPQIQDDPKGLGLLIKDSLVIETDGERIPSKVEEVRLHRVGSEPSFATLAEAKKAISENVLIPDDRSLLYVGDTVVDVVLSYGRRAPHYRISSTLDPGLPGQADTANLILDYAHDPPKIFRARGLLIEPIEISGRAFAGVGTFIYEGVRHILEGIDHVLFVVCLVIGAPNLVSLLWRVSGFTFGHSVTLSAGFFGFVPHGAWFVPAIEAGIALSIIYAAAVAMIPRQNRQVSGKRTIFITTVIGLLHGLGFSFVLKNILQIDAPNLWQSLFAFNLGVELGQVAIVLACWPAMRAISAIDQRAETFSRVTIASLCAVIALFWTVERLGDLLAV